MDAICRHYYISGRVQGVFYRRYSYEKARVLGLTGWVKNTEDDRVEVLLCGPPENIARMEKWFWEGPPKASVTNVESHERPLQNLNEFEVR